MLVVAVNFLVLIVACAIALAILELYYARTAKTGSGSLGRYSGDDRLNHAFTKNWTQQLTAHPEVPPYTFKTNELGLRYETEYTIAKPRGVKRLLVLGDSFVEGFEYAKSIPARLQVELEPIVRARGHELQVIHAGVGTYSPMLHYFALRYKLMQLEPDAVVMAIDLTDARDDYETYRKRLYFDADGEPAGVRSETNARKESLREGMVRALSPTSLDFWVAFLAPLHRAARATFDDNALRYMQRYRSLVSLDAEDLSLDRRLFDASDPRAKLRIEYSLSWVGRIDALLERDAIPLVVAMYPWKEQLEQPELLSYFEPYARFAAEHRFLFHCASPAFQRPDFRSLYLSNDPHFNDAGQAVWARSLSGFLAEHLDDLF